jgi:hypothetical protein
MMTEISARERHLTEMVLDFFQSLCARGHACDVCAHGQDDDPCPLEEEVREILRRKEGVIDKNTER